MFRRVKVVLFLIVGLLFSVTALCREGEDTQPAQGENATGAGEVYEVQEGDTFWSIAEKFYGDGDLWVEIFEANKESLGLSAPGDIRPGQKVVIPKVEWGVSVESDITGEESPGEAGAEGVEADKEPSEVETEAEAEEQPSPGELEETPVTPVEEEVVRAEEIVVTATRLPTPVKEVPAAVTIIDRSQIESIHAYDVRDVIERTAGVRILSYGGVGSLGTVSLRGLRSQHVLVMMDGRPLTSPSLGMTDLSHIPLDNIERIEIVRGPASALYGSGAIGGVINIITRKPPEKHSGGLWFSRGRWETTFVKGELGGPAGQWGYLFVGNQLLSRGHRDNTDYEARDAWCRFDYTFEGAEFSMQMGQRKSEAGRPGPRPAKNPADRTESQRQLGNDEVSSLFDRGDSLRRFMNSSLELGNVSLRTYVSDWDDDDHREFFAGFPAPVRRVAKTRYDTRYHGGEVQYSHNIFATQNEPQGLGRATLGIGIQEDEFEVSERVLNTATGRISYKDWDAERTTHWIFSQLELEETVVGRLTFGIRRDDPEDFSAQWSIRTGTSYDVDEVTTLYLSYGESFRAPTLNDIHWPTTEYARGNPDLEPETGKAYELGVNRDFSDRFSARVSVFHKEVEDMIAWGPTGPGGLWQPSNLNKLIIYGGEFEAVFHPRENIDVSLGWTRLEPVQSDEETVREVYNAFTGALESRITDRRRRQAAYVPKYKVDLVMTYKDAFGWEGLELALGCTHVSETQNYYPRGVGSRVVNYVTDIKKLSSYQIFDIKIRKTFGQAEFSIALDNIFDEEYATQFGFDMKDRDYPMPGRSVTAGLAIRF